MKTKILIIVILVGLGVFFFPKLSAWNEARLLQRGLATFDTYLKAAEEKDLEGVLALTYQVSEVCADEARRAECDERMENAHAFGEDMHREGMRILSADRNQMILVSDWLEDFDNATFSITRSIIFFIRDNGALKLLAFNPFDGPLIVKRGGEDREAVISRLYTMVADSDEDGLADTIETCEGRAPESGCLTTDPNKKDTDEDGFWDSTQSFFFKKVEETEN